MLRRTSNRPPLSTHMKIIAFDQATKTTGYAVIVDGQLTRHGVITAKASLDIIPRMFLMTRMIRDVIYEEKPDAVYFEGVESVRNERTMIYLANLQGMCLYSTHEAGYDVATFDPTVWRHELGFAVGRGVKRAENKAEAVRYARDKYSVECGDDEAEAICIATVAWKKRLDSKE